MTENQKQGVAWTCSRVPASKQHKCDSMACIEEIASLRSRCEELEKRCEVWLSHDCQMLLEIRQLQAERDDARKWARKILARAEEIADKSTMELMNESDWGDARRNERNEARRWAAKLYKENAQLSQDVDETGRAVIAGLKSTIADHGPIDKTLITSAAKRILGALKS